MPSFPERLDARMKLNIEKGKSWQRILFYVLAIMAIIYFALTLSQLIAKQTAVVSTVTLTLDDKLVLPQVTVCFSSDPYGADLSSTGTEGDSPLEVCPEDCPSVCALDTAFEFEKKGSGKCLSSKYVAAKGVALTSRTARGASGPPTAAATAFLTESIKLFNVDSAKPPTCVMYNAEQKITGKMVLVYSLDTDSGYGSITFTDNYVLTEKGSLVGSRSRQLLRSKIGSAQKGGYSSYQIKRTEVYSKLGYGFVEPVISGTPSLTQYSAPAFTIPDAFANVPNSISSDSSIATVEYDSLVVTQVLEVNNGFFTIMASFGGAITITVALFIYVLFCWDLHKDEETGEEKTLLGYRFAGKESLVMAWKDTFGFGSS
jgi:hypothetical protein